MPLFLWRASETLSRLDDLQFAAVVFSDFGGDDGSEPPSGDSLKELYNILARHDEDASRMARQTDSSRAASASVRRCSFPILFR
ncbi:UNVERIFIED_ORG: hypothetical protein GGI63_001892 [Rhizobium esperanzae]|nr:hypothetical protein RHECNPAF_430063 [Rhizobium etli CNPAF512]